MNKPQSPDPLKNARRFVYVATVLMPAYWYCLFHFDLPRVDILIVAGFYITSWLMVYWVGR